MVTADPNLPDAALRLTFWGVRGTLPVPGPGSVRYGGNTPCISVEVAGHPCLIFDAGSGIKALSDTLLGRDEAQLDAKIFITHPHSDHIHALPFFGPLYQFGHKIEVLGAKAVSPASSRLDTEVDGQGIEALIHAQMDGVFFPITPHDFSADVTFTDIDVGERRIGEIVIRSMRLNHPGFCLGYRIEYAGSSICYITDNELYPVDSEAHDPAYVEALRDFVASTDALIIDTTYLNDDYPAHMHWGHSCVSEVVRLADAAQVKTLYLFHHDPDQDDDQIDAKLAQARRQLRELGSPVTCVCPSERDQVLLSAPVQVDRSIVE